MFYVYFNDNDFFKVRTNAVKENMKAQGIKIEKTEDFAKYAADVKYNCSLFL